MKPRPRRCRTRAPRCFAFQVAAPARDRPGGTARSPRPSSLAIERHQDAVGRAGGRVLGYAAAGRKERLTTAWSRPHRATAATITCPAPPLARPSPIVFSRARSGDSPRTVASSATTASRYWPAQTSSGVSAQGPRQVRPRLDPARRIGGEIHFQPRPAEHPLRPAHGQFSRQGVEGQQRHVDAQFLEQGMGAGQGGVAADRGLDGRGEPAQAATGPDRRSAAGRRSRPDCSRPPGPASRRCPARPSKGSTTQAGLPLNGPEAKASMVHWRMARLPLEPEQQGRSVTDQSGNIVIQDNVSPSPLAGEGRSLLPSTVISGHRAWAEPVVRAQPPAPHPPGIGPQVQGEQVLQAERREHRKALVVGLHPHAHAEGRGHEARQRLGARGQRQDRARRPRTSSRTTGARGPGCAPRPGSPQRPLERGGHAAGSPRPRPRTRCRRRRDRPRRSP